MNRPYFKALLAAVVGGIFAASPDAQATLIFTIENPGIQSTTVAGATTETFESVPLGYITSYNSLAVDGIYSSGQVIPADVFGGAGGGGQYDVVGLGGTTSQFLTFNSPKTYFGMWWSAGDAENVLKFYDGDDVLATYNVGSIIPYLSSAYYGNPNGNYAGQNLGEPYVYLNFTALDDSFITKIEFINSGFNGYETDNHSVASQRLDTPPGHSVPDGGTTIAMLSLAFTTLAAARRKLS